MPYLNYLRAELAIGREETARLSSGSDFADLDHEYNPEHSEPGQATTARPHTRRTNGGDASKPASPEIMKRALKLKQLGLYRVQTLGAAMQLCPTCFTYGSRMSRS